MEDDAGGAWASFRDEHGTPKSALWSGYLDAPDPVPTGIGALDAVLDGGMSPGVYALCGEPGAGKSALAAQIAMKAAIEGTNALYVSLEMSSAQVYIRMAAALSTLEGRKSFSVGEAREHAKKVRKDRARAMRVGGGAVAAWERGFMEHDPVAVSMRALDRACPSLAVADDCRLCLLPNLLDECGRAHEAGAGLIVIDYLHEVVTGHETTEVERVGAVSAALASFAKTRRVPVLVLSAMAKPSASMMGSKQVIKGSAAAGHDATGIWLLTSNGEDGPTGRAIDLHVLKNRDGRQAFGPSALHLMFDGAHCLFS